MRFVYFLIIYYPLHEVVLRYSGLTGSPLYLARQWADIAIISVFLALTGFTAIYGRLAINRKGIATWTSLFVIQGAFITLLNENSSNITGLSEIFVLIRFTFILGIVILLKPSQREIDTAIRLILYCSIVQMGIGALQFLLGEPFLSAFRPADYTSFVSGEERSFTSNRVTERKYLIGTAGDLISYGYILAIGMIISIFYFKSIGYKILLVTCFLILLFLTGSRTIFLSSILTILVYGVWSVRIDWRVIYTLLGTITLPILFIFLRSLTEGVDYRYDKFSALFTPQIIESLLNQRLGVLLYILPEFISSGDFIIGFSPDKNNLVNYVAENYTNAPPVLLATLRGTVEDFYILCLFLYYGVFGFFTLVCLYYCLWKICCKVHVSNKYELGKIGVALLICGLLFNVGNQAFENRIFSFYFWLIMGFNASIHYSKSKVNWLASTKQADKLPPLKNHE